jgi:hypothetical protein
MNWPTLEDMHRHNEGLHDRIGATLDSLGGVLRCGHCRSEHAMYQSRKYLRDGWPECCGFTMTWVTARQLAGERNAPS